MGKRDTLMLKTDELAGGLMNFKHSIDFICRADKKLLARNVKLKEHGKEDFCFVLGNGPSLKKIDLKSIEAYPCVTVNFFHKGAQEFDSSYHLFIDAVFGGQYFDYVKEFKKAHPETKLILRDNMAAKMKQAGLEDNNNYYIRADYVQKGDEIRCDMTKEMTGSLNVIPVAIECALYMGYKKIYLLGCDFNSYAVVKDEHFYDGQEGGRAFASEHVVGDLIRCALVHKQHFALQECSKKRGIKIMNLTEGSLVSAYERGHLEDILVNR